MCIFRSLTVNVAFLLVLKQFNGREFCHTVYLRDSISLLRYQTEDDSLPSYLANKKDMKLDFEQNPTVLKGVKCLEQELNQGQTFLKQSKDLREMVQQVSRVFL